MKHKNTIFFILFGIFGIFPSAVFADFDAKYLFGTEEINIAPGEKTMIDFSFTNTGKTLWGKPHEEFPVFLNIQTGEQDISDAFSNWGWSNEQQIVLSSTVEDISTFSAEITAPDEEGEYSFVFQLFDGKKSFGPLVPFHLIVDSNIAHTGGPQEEEMQQNDPYFQEKFRILESKVEEQRNIEILLEKLQKLDKEVETLKDEKTRATPEKRQEIEKKILAVSKLKDDISLYHLAEYQDEPWDENFIHKNPIGAKNLSARISITEETSTGTRIHPDFYSALFLIVFAALFLLLRKREKAFVFQASDEK